MSLFKKIFLILLCLANIVATAQKNDMVFPQLGNHTHKENKGSTIQQTPMSGSIMPSLIEQNWNVTVKNMSAYNHTSPVSTEEFKKYKEVANLKRKNIGSNNVDMETAKKNTVTPPLLNRNFRGNNRGTSVPMDNSMAISRNGFIVSGINSNIIFTSPDGVITYEAGFPDFFTLLGLGTRMYDPRVLYDVETNRFIFMCLHGSEPANTFLCIAFSKTEDPNGEWNYYKIDGNPSGDDRWFDYPNIAISNNDLYIAGLMRDTPGDWQYSVLYQLNKHQGYGGQDITWKYYNELQDANGDPSFNLVPTPSGWDYLLTPGMYFTSNKALGGNLYNLYYTTDSVGGNPSLISVQTTGLETALAPDGRQKGTSNVLNTFDSRIWSALYLDGTIHMGSHVNTENGDVGLFYGRFDVANVKVDADVLITPGVDYGFPSFTAFGSTEDEDKIMVNYLYTGADLFPGQQQRACQGTGTDFQWSEPTTLKEGTSIINALSDNNERWGDYTTSCKRFINGRTENWVTGSFGETNGYGTWLGQLVSETEFNSVPMAEFVADKTTTPAGSNIQFTDLTQKNPSNWQWLFPSGIPSTSTEQNPTITYSDNGAFDVQLIVTTELGIDTITKIAYIHIQDQIVKPTADFSIAKDTVFKGDYVLFSNLSTINASQYKWTLQSGTPSSSTEKNPVIQYNKLGSHLVSLTAENIAGSNTKTKLKAVTVLPRVVPTALFGASSLSIAKNEDVQFMDLSTGGPTEWEWVFEGGNPSISSDQNPLITYPEDGVYDVSLTVRNEAGEHTIALTDYIQVGQVSTKDVDFLQNVKLYPNPATNDRVNVVFHTEKSQKMTFNLVDGSSKLVKTLYSDKIKSGINELSFNVESLVEGIYYIHILNQSGEQKTVYFLKIN